MILRPKNQWLHPKISAKRVEKRDVCDSENIICVTPDCYEKLQLV